MKKDFGKKTWLYPMPVLIIGTYDKDGNPNLMNAAWGGIFNSNQICICIDKSHKTTKNVVETKAFTVSIADTQNVIACDYVGISSANNTSDKIAKSGFTLTKSKFVNAPVVEELKMVLECEAVGYNEETEQLVGNIINVAVDESILTDDKVDLSKFSPITFDSVNNNYVELGKIVGKAFSDGKKLM